MYTKKYTMKIGNMKQHSCKNMLNIKKNCILIEVEWLVLQ